MSSHQSHKMIKDEWITPKYIIDAFGYGFFDLDPCAAVRQPWSCARDAYTVEQDGLAHNWYGNVWLNPPYGRHTGTWLSRLVEHGTGMSLIFARTETEDWFSHIWTKADAILFIEGRLHFCHVDGTRAENNSGAPSALIAYGNQNAQALLRCGLPGRVVFLKQSVLIEASGGVVTALHSNDPQIKADLLDWDEFNEGADVSQEEIDAMYQRYKTDMPFDLMSPESVSEQMQLALEWRW